ncbi:GntR family transcriptional regulator [Microlunatus spumicola]|jgi:GntR family transcriptional regulator|uniref:GntR family transcriptional regulator n=1 Tax=Microlunatus spumicola TaxID=81499 RepID=A0ABP6X0R3_9ACTN
MLRVDTSSAVPPFEQLRVQLLEQIASGDLAPGTQLPTVRRLAADLGLAPNTVARTYRELEQAGLVQTARRRGTIVAAPLGQTRIDAHHAAEAFVRHMRALGLDTTDMVQLVRQAATS